jgi:rhodanese-related sulfurtransferase
LPPLATISVTAFKRELDAKSCTAFDLRPSMRFREAHVPASRWSIRPRLVQDARNVNGRIVLIADEPDSARAAAIDLLEAGHSDVKLLEGGITAWRKAGEAIAASADVPADDERIDYLFFVHDRHAGNREAMKQYLAWETGLIAQLDAEDRKLFRVGRGS